MCLNPSRVRDRRRGDLDRRRPWAPAEDAALRRLVAAGVGEKATAEATGRSVAAVRCRRRRLGLPPFGYSADERRRRAERATARGASQRWAAGVLALARRYRLPAGLRVREVQIVLALLDGPLSGDQLAARLGVTRDAVTGRPRGSYTARLTAAGLLARLTGPRGRRLYLLTPLALDLLADATKEPPHGR